jgi:hypothetical protein
MAISNTKVFGKHFDRDISDIFFDEYLDVFSDKMSGLEDPSDPVWKAYKDKFKEHQEAQSNFKLANYYLGML